MKLKKHNYAIAAIVLYCFTSYKSFSYKRFTVLLVVITSLFSSYIYSQQPTISGLENIHISEGATIITEHTDNKITVITSSSTKTYSQEEKFNHQN
jgi:asparagine N-glycosylation enzyme membrane subunit Stt3